MVYVLSRVLVLCFGLRSGEFCDDLSGGSCVLKLRFGADSVPFSEIRFRFVWHSRLEIDCSYKKCNSIAKTDFAFWTCVLKLRFDPPHFAFWAYLSQSGCVLGLRFGLRSGLSHFAFWIQQIHKQLQRPRLAQSENSNTLSSLWYDIGQARIHLHNESSLVVLQGADWQSNLITGRWERDREREGVWDSAGKARLSMQCVYEGINVSEQR